MPALVQPAESKPLICSQRGFQGGMIGDRGASTYART